MSDTTIGIDAIAYAIRSSKVLSGSDLALLGNVATLPTDEEIEACAQTDHIKELFDATIGDSQTRDTQLHLKAKQLLAEGRIAQAWMVLLAE